MQVINHKTNCLSHDSYLRTEDADVSLYHYMYRLCTMFLKWHNNYMKCWRHPNVLTTISLAVWNWVVDEFGTSGMLKIRALVQ